jgi:hypothetical protein
VYFCVQRFEEREVIVSFVEDHMSCIFEYTTCDPQQN